HGPIVEEGAMQRRWCLVQLGCLALVALALQGCDFFCLVEAIFTGHPEACPLILPSGAGLECALPGEPGTTYVLPIGDECALSHQGDCALSNPCERAPGLPSAGHFAPGDSFTFDDPPDGLQLITLGVTPDGVPSFFLLATRPLNALVAYTYSTGAGDVGKGFLDVRTPSTDLAVTMRAAPNPARAQEPLPYPITAPNNGPATATGVTLTDPLPGTVTLVAATPSQGSCSGTSTVRCSLGTLANGSAATVSMVVTPTQAGSLSNTASVQANESDSNAANNAFTVLTVVDPVPSANVTMTISATPDPVEFGQALTYTIIITNHGPDDALDLVLDSELVPTMLFDPSVNEGPLHCCDVVTVPPGCDVS